MFFEGDRIWKMREMILAEYRPYLKSVDSKLRSCAFILKNFTKLFVVFAESAFEKRQWIEAICSARRCPVGKPRWQERAEAAPKLVLAPWVSAGNRTPPSTVRGDFGRRLERTRRCLLPHYSAR